jgi:hypothetical protein
MSDHTTTVDTHLAGYCDPDPARRLERLTRAWADDGVLVDPPMDGAGPAGIADLVEVVLGHYPGHRFERTTALDTHHEHARYGWALLAPNGDVAVTGVDVAEFDDDGKLRRIVGFFGDMAPKEPEVPT